ncbi:sensor histidine kinase [Jiella sonneratiae]|uniref:histidine kinase n=1 Tax=Jiella sonneratiae TaxID=2816856 RepID=A0ABS3J8T3_9HYPH|nr:ATP-binding protein [Jiella sonneratiae]MBO0906077.1 HAMP domain-containing protein [Jiella sonneratiae]
MPLSLATRIALIFVSALLAVWLSALGLVYAGRAGDGELAGLDPARIGAIVALLEASGPAARARVLAAVRSDALDAALDDEAPGPPGDAGLPAAAARLRQDLEASLAPRPVAVSSGSGRARAIPRPFLDARDTLRVRIGLETGETLVLTWQERLPLTPLGLPVGFGAGLLGTLIAFAALLVMHRETRPIRRLAAAADRMDLSARPLALVPPRASAPEIRQLYDAFDRLQTRLSNLLRARMAMVGGISHDVRTFATRLRLRVDAIPAGPEREGAIADIADMIRLLDDALLTSRTGAEELAEELVDFESIVADEVAHKRSDGAAVTLAVAPQARNASVLGDRLALRRIVFNLVDNAVKYGGAAHVGLGVEAGFLVLLVEDEGPGVPEAIRDIIFEPFVRMEASRSRATGGAGLGLAVVRGLVEAHRGTLSVGAAASGGARFDVRLPLFVAA